MVPVDEEREYARKYVKDQPARLLSSKLSGYGQCLAAPFKSEDLVPVSEIRISGRKLRAKCFSVMWLCRQRVPSPCY